MLLSLRFDKRAEADLLGLADWIGTQADPETARAYIKRKRTRCLRLLDSPRGGRVRRKGRPPIRSVPFERSATILYRAGQSEVVVLRVIPRGRDVDALVRHPR
ncbi:MAG TPA: type II toxin-antitoxin system RelE/ParE family toxin [Sphingomonadaceae bacterium]|nr:type II toxin-antitoxin system RelE/ParE family toxin [Sphingomonadaceae bacterium]